MAITHSQLAERCLRVDICPVCDEPVIVERDRIRRHLRFGHYDTYAAAGQRHWETSWLLCQGSGRIVLAQASAHE